MRDKQKRTASASLEACHHCPICTRKFTQESTWKRHYYYCRSKLPDTNISRRKSCAACVRAKTRCIRPAGTLLEACARCNQRGAECELDATVQRRGVAHHSDLSSTPGLSLSGDEDLDALSLTPQSTSSSSSGGWQVSTLPQTYLNSPDPPKRAADDTWDANFGEIDLLGLDGTTVDSQGIDSLLGTFSGAPDAFINGASLTPWSLQLSTPPLFKKRTFTRPSQGPLVSLALQILRSYPFMILKKAALPPFISPLLFSWAELGVEPAQQALTTCVGLVHLFKSRTASNRGLVWKLIRHEQERILAEYAEFDRWELLAALQALLIYCLLRLQDVPAGNDGLEAALLTTVNLIFNTMTLSAGGILKMKLPDDPNLSWTDWIYNESRRRTVLIFQILNTIVEMTTEASAYANCGLVLIPLASNATLWSAMDPEVWRAEFNLCYKRSMYGVSHSGVLTRLQLNDNGVKIYSLDWEEWRAEVGDIGTLVMLVGALL